VPIRLYFRQLKASNNNIIIWHYIFCAWSDLRRQLLCI